MSGKEVGLEVNKTWNVDDVFMLQIIFFFLDKLVCYHPAGVITAIISIPPLFLSSQPRIMEELKNKILRTYFRGGAVGSGLLFRADLLFSSFSHKVLNDGNRSCKPVGRVFNFLSRNPTES